GLIEPPRREMMQSLLERAGRRAGGGRLLDVGCGGGHFMAAAVACGWRPIGTDLSREACTAARRTAGVPVTQADADALPFRTGAPASRCWRRRTRRSRVPRRARRARRWRRSREPPCAG